MIAERDHCLAQTRKVIQEIAEIQFEAKFTSSKLKEQWLHCPDWFDVGTEQKLYKEHFLSYNLF